MTGHPRAELVPGEARIFAWIEEIVAQGIRRPGLPADEWVERWAAKQLEDLGVDDVRLEGVELPVWDFRSASVEVWPRSAPDEAVVLDAFALPHTSPTSGLEADVVAFADGANDVSGSIALDHLALSTVPQALVRGLATSVHDPDGDFDTLVQTLPFGSKITGVLDPVLEAGAAGFIGVLSGMPWETHDYYVPYDAVERPLPAVWLSPSAGRRLADLNERGPLRARITVDAERRPGVSHNVVGVLSGASDEWVVIGSHHDAPWASAVEDASGIALVLAQAAYWAGVPEAERPHNLCFLLTAGHMTHAAGTAAFIRDHADLLERTVLEVHLEHTANECVPDGDGGLTPTGHPEVRWWFTTQEPGLEASVAAALAAEDLRRSMVYRPDVFFEFPPTDGGFFHQAGVPLVNFLTAPMYLFDSCDTLDKVHRASLEPVTRAAVRIISDLRGRTAAEVRAGARGLPSPAPQPLS